MGCKSSRPETRGEGLFKEETDVRKSLLTGIEAKRNGDGLEGNFQIAFAKKKHKRYEKVPET